MTGDDASTISSLLTPLLRAVEMLAFVARHFHPPYFDDLLNSIGNPEDAMGAAHATTWPENLSAIRKPIDEASEVVLSAYAGLRQGRDLTDVRRAFRLLPDALEILYPLASILSPVNLFFLDPARRTGTDIAVQLLGAPPRDNTGVMRFDKNGSERGGYWLYVPEIYTPDREYPLVMALHGGSGTGRRFLWSWLRDARSHEAILISPTSIGNTWALMGPDVDSPNLAHILASVRARWSIDPARMLLTGMSDGGTFSYVSGLSAESPFTHLAPVAATFHPMLVQIADADRVQGLPIHIVHGALDWMFPVEVASSAQRALAVGGANVTYREIADLSHTYPFEANAGLLAWLNNTRPRQI